MTADIPITQGKAVLRIEHDAQCGVLQGAIHSEIASIKTRLDKLEGRMDSTDLHFQELHKALDENTAATTQTLDIIRSAQGFFKVAGWIGKGVQWAAGIGAALLALWVALKDAVR